MDEIINNIFIPSSPIVEENQCYGRTKEIEMIIKNILQPGKHLLLFGGRGFGKTSIGNIITKRLNSFFSVKINCHRNQEKFEDICFDLLNKIKDKIELKEKHQFSHNFIQLLDKILDTKKINQVLLISLFKLATFPILMILDEADLINKKTENISKFTDLIKALSDQVPMVKFLIIGIAETSHEFIGDHISLERCLTEIKIDRMSTNDLQDILEGGLIKLKMNISDEAKESIIAFSEGFPYYIHLLGLYIVEDALKLNYKTIVKKNYFNGVIQSILNTKENLNATLEKAIGRSKGDTYQKILEACLLFEEKSLQENYSSANFGGDQVSYVFNPIYFTSRDIFLALTKKRNNKFDGDEKKVTRILKHLSEKRKVRIFINKKNPINSYCFFNPLFKAYLHYKLYERGEVSHSVFFLS